MNIFSDFDEVFPEHKVMGYRYPEAGDICGLDGKVFTWDGKEEIKGRCFILESKIKKIDWTKVYPELLVSCGTKTHRLRDALAAKLPITGVLTDVWYASNAEPRDYFHVEICIISQVNRKAVWRIISVKENILWSNT